LQLKFKSTIDVDAFIGELTPRSIEGNLSAHEKPKIPCEVVSREDSPEKNVKEMDIVEEDVKNMENGVSDAKADKTCSTTQADIAKYQPLMWKEIEVLVGEKAHQSRVGSSKKLHDPSDISMAIKTAVVVCGSDDVTDDASNKAITSQSNNVGKKTIQMCKEYSHEENVNECEMEERNKGDKNKGHDGDDAISAGDVMGFAWQIAQGMVCGE